MEICLDLGLTVALSPKGGGIAIGMGVFQVGAGLILYTLGSRSLPAAELAPLSLAEVLLGPPRVWLFWGNRERQHYDRRNGSTRGHFRKCTVR